MTPEATQLIDMLKAKGYRVFAPEQPTTYVYFTEQDGKRIGYAQINRFEGLKYSTVHKPHTQVGTGYAAKDDKEALSLAPDWALQRDIPFIKKYDDIEDFRKQHWQKLVEY